MTSHYKFKCPICGSDELCVTEHVKRGGLVTEIQRYSDEGEFHTEYDETWIDYVADTVYCCLHCNMEWSSLSAMEENDCFHLIEE